MNWAYGVTTVPSRLNTILPRTLQSLAGGGFSKPHLFVDGGTIESNLPMTCRIPAARTAIHWTLSLCELLLQNPYADRFALFQDDLICCRNLRQYLEDCPYPLAGYCNCYTFPVNEDLRPNDKFIGWYQSNQRGLGAVALVFDYATTLTLLSSKDFLTRPRDSRRGWRAIDGGVVTVLKHHGIQEYVHYPSLVQHTGGVSSMGNHPFPASKSFVGESFVATDLVRRQ